MLNSAVRSGPPSVETAKRLVDAGIWPRRDPGLGTRYETPEQRRAYWTKYNAKRNRKHQGEAYRRRLQQNARYMDSLGKPPRRAWEEWERQFVAEHPFHSCREIAAALGRSVKSVIEMRLDPDGSKRRARYRRARDRKKAACS